MRVWSFFGMVPCAAVVSALVIVAYSQKLALGAGAAPLVARQDVRNFSNRTLARIIPGHTTKAQVQALLGKPWRDTELDKESIPYQGDPSVDIWEYRGRDSKGTYRIHIEFDKHDTTTLVAKVPDKTGRAVAKVAKPL